MSRSILFGYSVAREDGKVVVTIEGPMAGQVMGGLAGRGPRGGRSPFPFGPLGSPAMGLATLFATGEEIAEDNADDAVEPSLADVFGQGFDRSYGEYEARLKAYREILAQSGEEEEFAFGGTREFVLDIDADIPGSTRKKGRGGRTKGAR